MIDKLKYSMFLISDTPSDVKIALYNLILCGLHLIFV
jgi:hypothetical protein